MLVFENKPYIIMYLTNSISQSSTWARDKNELDRNILCVDYCIMAHHMNIFPLLNELGGLK